MMAWIRKVLGKETIPARGERLPAHTPGILELHTQQRQQETMKILLELESRMMVDRRKKV